MKPIFLALFAVVGGLAFTLTRPVRLPFQEFHGMADASAMELLDEHWLVVANDEDNWLRIYHREQLEAPVRSLDLSPFLRLENKGKKRVSEEVDLEGSARFGDLIFWISSHGRNAAGERAASRQRLLATKVGTIAGVPWVHPVGTHYTDLVDDLVAEPRFAQLGLSEAAHRAPKSPGGLNIEALAFTPSGTLLIGFRSPVPEGEALIIPVLNPMELIRGVKPQFGDPLQLALGGQGIRGMTQAGKGYWIVAGSTDGNGISQLYHWAGGTDAPRLCSGVNLKGFNAEGIALAHGSTGDVLVLASDDGTRSVEGRPAKRLKNPSQQTFRIATIPAPIVPVSSDAEPTSSTLTPPLAQARSPQP